VLPTKNRGGKIVPQKSKLKIDVYTDAPLSLVSRKVAATTSGSMRKKQSEEPIYLKRI
jgi:hypothetical protein